MEMTYLLQIGQVVVYAIIATVFVMVIRGRVDNVETKMEIKMSALEAQMSALHAANLKFGDILTQIAVQRTEITGVQEAVRELRHGRGFIRDILNGEYDNKGKMK
jgi:archaellum biogenesis protein FlaJ (TadC family)